MIHQMFSFPNPAPVKTVLAQQGLIANELRSPMQVRRRRCSSGSPQRWRSCSPPRRSSVKFVS